MGLERLDAGEVVFEGVEYSPMRERPLRRVRRRMHLVLQDPYQSLHPAMRLASAVAEPLRIAGTGDARSPKVAEALEEVGLAPAVDYLRRYPHELSGGQRQRVVLARALVGRPRLVVADEPTSMVDASLRTSIVALIRDLRDRHGIAFPVITHDLDMAAAVAEQVAVMRSGRIVESGRTADIFGSPGRSLHGSAARRRGGRGPVVTPGDAGDAGGATARHELSRSTAVLQSTQHRHRACPR